jgi:DNA-binding response OmpR family regulator
MTGNLGNVAPARVDNEVSARDSRYSIVGGACQTPSARPSYTLTMRSSKILVVDDEPKIRRIVTSYLIEEGFDVAEAHDGESALVIAGSDLDLIVLDIGLPGIDGIEVLRELRSRSDVPVILVTARAEETDRLIGLSVGADDYMTKPFSPRELVLRVKAILRRSSRVTDRPDGLNRFEDLTIDEGARVVEVDGDEVELTALEFDLLVALAGAPGLVLSRHQLIEQVWGWDFVGDERVVDVHIRNLRKKMRDDAGEPRFITTVRGVGYKFAAHSS